MPPRLPITPISVAVRSSKHNLPHAAAAIPAASAASAAFSSSSTTALSPCAFRRHDRIAPSFPRRAGANGIRRMSAAPPAPSNNNDGLSIEQYHRLADTTLETMLDAFEAMAEEDESVTDVEYSNHVLTLAVAPGTYVFNKQPPNKQLWLSSPISGPKRYDWDAERKQWVCGRDDTTLDQLLKEEFGLEMSWEDL